MKIYFLKTFRIYTVVSCLFIALLLNNGQACAQSDFRSGYLITNEGDTIQGLIDYRGDLRNSKTCSFKTNSNDQVVDYKPDEIKAYRFHNSKYYLSKNIEIDSEKVQLFIEYLVDGIVDLYYLAHKNAGYYLLEKEDGTLVKLETQLKNNRGNQVFKYQEYVGILKNAMQKYPVLFDQIDRSKLSHQSLGQLINNYHNLACNDQECVVYTKDISKIRFNFNLTGGINWGSIHFSNGPFMSDNYKNAFYPTVGFSTDISLPQINEKLSLYLNARIGKTAFFSVEEINDYSHFIRTNEIYLLPLIYHAGLKYTYPKGTYRPYAGIGAGFYMPANLDASQRIEYIERSKIWTTLEKDPGLIKPLPGITACLGCNVRRKSKKVGSVQAEYNFNGKTYHEMRVVSKVFSFSASYYF